MHEIEEVQQLLAEHQRWHVWVLEYGLTHSFMRLALHIDSYPRHTAVECSGCLRFEGDLQGGPYSLVVRVHSWRGTPAVELRADDDSFVLVCEHMRVGRRVT